MNHTILSKAIIAGAIFILIFSGCASKYSILQNYNLNETTMSGGHFEYNQYKIGYIADEIQAELDKMGKEIPESKSMASLGWYKRSTEKRLYTTYPDEIVKEFKNAIRSLRITKIYAHRVDWFLSGDDGEEEFVKRLKEDLEEFNDSKR